MRIIAILLIFILTVISGCYLRSWGRPYPVWVFTLHKFLSIGFLVLAIIAVYPYQIYLGKSWINTGLIILFGGGFMSALVTGGIMDQNESVREWIRWGHKISSLALFIIGILLIFRFYHL